MGLTMVRITQEAVFNTFNTGAAAGLKADIFLPSADACTVQKTPMFTPIRDAGVGNRLIRRLPGRYTVGGSLNTYLFPSQALLLTNLATEFVGSTPCLDIPSFTLDQVMLLDDNCLAIYQRTTGCKIAKLDLSADQSDSGYRMMAKMDIMGSIYNDTITVTDFPTPVFSAYPADNPFAFSDLAGNLTIDSVRTNFQSFNLSIANVLKGFPDENLYMSSIGWKGRDVTMSTKLKYKAATDRQSWNTGALHAISAEFNNGTHTVTFDLKSSNSFTAVSDSRPLDDYYTQTISAEAMVDPSALTDLAITVT